MPKANREYVLVQSELFKDPDDVQGIFERVQTFISRPAGGAILDIVRDKGESVYPIVTHSLTDALRGAVAILKAGIVNV